jgi:glutathione S-transferase
VRFSPRAQNTLFVLLLPVAVAVFDLEVVAVLVLLALGLLWRWGIVLGTLTRPGRGPDLRLETIGASHFVEKVRWCLDRLGIPYQETQNVGALGVFTLGRTVPRLHVRTGTVVFVIGNSSDILRFLWGRYGLACGERAAFLAPDPEAVELEGRLDRYGVNLQRWIYHHLLADRQLTLHVWGANDRTLPAWQRAAVRASFPLLRVLMRRAFRLGPDAHPRVTASIERQLGDLETLLADGRPSLSGLESPGFADITLAALSGLWVNPAAYGGGRADSVWPASERLPPRMAAEMAAWREAYPRVTAHVERLYRDERGRRPDTEAR